MTHPDTTTCKASWINPIYAGTAKESWYCQEHKAPVFPYEPPTEAKASPEAHPDTPELDELISAIYGKDVVPNAYASPAGRLTKKQAKASLTHLLAKRELEGRIDEVEDFKTGAEEHVAFTHKINRLAELREELARYDNPKEKI